MAETPESILARHLADQNGVSYEDAINGGVSDHDIINEFSAPQHNVSPVATHEAPADQPNAGEIDPAKRAVWGALAGSPFTGAGVAGSVLKGGTKVANKVFNATPSEPPRFSFDTSNPLYEGHELHPGSIANAEFNAHQRLANELRANPTLNSTVDSLLRDRRAMEPINADQMRREIEAAKPFLTKVAENPAVRKAGNIAVGAGKAAMPVVNKIAPVLGLASAAAQEADMENRWNRGDLRNKIQAAISGLGAAGSAGATWPWQPPIARGIEAGVGVGAPALNAGIDWALGDPHKQPVHKADGGLAQPKKFDEGGGIRLSQDEVIQNALNHPSRTEILKRMGSDFGDQLKKEWAHPDRQMAVDLTGNVSSDLLGMPSDIVHGLSNVSPIQGKANPFGSNSYDAKMQAAKAKMEAQRRGQIPMFGSANLKHQLEHSGITSGTERPATELGLSFAGPWALEKAPSLLAKTPEMLRALEYNPVGMSIKDVGGNWIPSAQVGLEDQLGILSRTRLPGVTMPQYTDTNRAVNNWASTTGRKYILNRLGSSQDEIKNLYDQGIMHLSPTELAARSEDFHSGSIDDLEALNRKRARAGITENNSAKTELGQNWENTTDAAIQPIAAKHYQWDSMKSPDWVHNLDPESLMYRQSNKVTNLPKAVGIDKLTQALEKDIELGKLRPEQLNKVSIEDAVRRAHQQRLEGEAATESAAQAIPKVKEYPSGYAWHDLTHEDPATLDAILGKEGETMQNCIKGYCSDVLEDGTKLYSLRDPAGNPHVNVEVIQNRDGSPMIRQIKGKQNDMPVEDYHPYVQDFIKNPVGGQDFSVIGDIEGSGLMEADRIRKHGLAGDSMGPYYGELDRIFPNEIDNMGSRVLAGPHGVRIPSTDMLRMATENMPGKYVTQQDVLNHLATQEPRPIEQGYSKYYDQNMAQGGQVQHFAGGRLVEPVTAMGEVSNAYRKAQAMIEAENNRKKFSQVLIPHEGSYLGLTQSDNFGIHGNRYGGTQFPMFQQFSPIHKDNKVVWMNDTEAHANNMAKNSTFNNKPVVWSNYIGSPDQLRSNKSVFQDVLDAHYGRDLSPEQIDLINARIKALSKGNAKKPVFQEPFDIRDRFATQELGGDTFGGRRTLVNMLGEGEGVNKTKSGIILPEFQDILASHRDPITEGVDTSSIGSRLFKVDPTPSSYSTEYHPDYNWTVHGEDLNQPFEFTPHSVLDWHDAHLKGVDKNGDPNSVPHGNSWFSYMKDPQFIDENFIRKVKDAGYAKGGEVQHFGIGGDVEAINAITRAYEAAKALPPAENAARTQIIGTLPTYQKAAAHLKDVDGPIIDFGAGLGKGAEEMSNILNKPVHTYEPFAKDWTPTYSNAGDIPSNTYSGLTGLNMLNVIPRDVRDQAVSDIGRVLDRNGLGVLTTRGKDVMKAQGRLGPEPTSIITSRDTYQKGFSPQELEDYLKYILGSKFDINKINLGPAGTVIRKK